MSGFLLDYYAREPLEQCSLIEICDDITYLHERNAVIGDSLLADEITRRIVFLIDRLHRWVSANGDSAALDAAKRALCEATVAQFQVKPS